MPAYLLDRTYHEDPRYETQQTHQREDAEGQGEVSGALHEGAGNRGRHHSREVADKVLEAHPASGSMRSSQSLRDSEDIRAAHTDKECA